MDLYFTIKSVLTSGTNLLKYNELFEEPINIIDNLYYCNLYNINNYSIVRDYNFKNIIYLQKNLELDKIQKHGSLEIKYHTEKFNLDDIYLDKQVEKIIDTINNIMLYEDTLSELKQNVILYSESIDYVYMIIMCLMVLKYNYSIKKSIRFVEKRFGLKTNTFIPESKIINLLEKFI